MLLFCLFLLFTSVTFSTRCGCVKFSFTFLFIIQCSIIPTWLEEVHMHLFAMTHNFLSAKLVNWITQKHKNINRNENRNGYKNNQIGLSQTHSHTLTKSLRLSLALCNHIHSSTLQAYTYQEDKPLYDCGAASIHMHKTLSRNQIVGPPLACRQFHSSTTVMKVCSQHCY